ncbi:hypothetical protein ACLOJK_034187 [Asimina triloba]
MVRLPERELSPIVGAGWKTHGSHWICCWRSNGEDARRHRCELPPARHAVRCLVIAAVDAAATRRSSLSDGRKMGFWGGEDAAAVDGEDMLGIGDGSLDLEETVVAIILVEIDPPTCYPPKTRRTAAMAVFPNVGDGAPNQCFGGAWALI